MANPVTPEELLEFVPVTADGIADPASASMALEVVTGAVDAYTRGRHKLADDTYKPGIRSVILTAAARVIVNPSAVTTRLTAGSVTVSKGEGFTGFTLAERMTLDRYRVRAR